MIEGHGDDSYRYNHPIVMNFSSNIYSHADLSGLHTYLHERMGVISSYPEPSAASLETRLANFHQIPQETVLVTNGATEAIYLIAQSYACKNVQVLQPTFREYADACTINGCKVSALYQLPTEREHFRLDNGVEMLWLCNPNNPTGYNVTTATITLQDPTRIGYTFKPKNCLSIFLLNITLSHLGT